MKKLAILMVAIMTAMLLGACSTGTVYAETSTKEIDENAPVVTVMSSCGIGTSRGRYTVSSPNYGAICSGRGYSDKETAVSKPLEIDSKGNEVVVNLTDDDTAKVELYAGDAELISCESGNFYGYLYIVVT